jgi:hypothetical protein
VEDIETTPSAALSVGSVVGFGFMGLIFGSFLGWCVGLVTRAAGINLLKYMIFTGIIASVVGVLAGMLLTKSTSRPKAA